jgi:hypothetical protein
VQVETVMEFDNVETIKRSVEVGSDLSILPASAWPTSYGRAAGHTGFAEGRSETSA